ncbi:hypothetical protein HB364_20555 [Pseudoflavitalea sp. X16]|uniref:hypothetical protein n=1 Tax=Paraflavitalea devenefica TaxID=2716334 RepID=UPI001420D903|nr:hypothetical protein [Paraflavitalea devenefica]NII27492.1 hypothetical protein [Paraflavitalea devenefica]
MKILNVRGAMRLSFNWPSKTRLLRHALGAALNGKTGSSLNGRMNGMFCKAARQDGESDLGSRRASKGATGMLTGFDFNKQLSLAYALPVRLTHQLDVETGVCRAELPCFIARKRKGFPVEATHFRIISGVAMIDFICRGYRQDVQRSALLPLSKKTPADICFEHWLEPGEGKVMVQALGMQFYKLVEGKEVLVKGSAVRILEVVRIETQIKSELHELECGSVREDTNQGKRTLEEEGNEALRQQGNEETRQEIQYEDGLGGTGIEEELQGTRIIGELHELGVRVEKAEVVLLE